MSVIELVRINVLREIKFVNIVFQVMDFGTISIVWNA